MMKTEDKFPCPCCGYKVFVESPGSYDICPICFWEDDLSQLRFPGMAGGANHPSLIQAQQNYEKLGASDKRHRASVRSLNSLDIRDSGWRAIDPGKDNIEIPDDNRTDYGSTYPKDSIVLYYWRSTYWRRRGR